MEQSDIMLEMKAESVCGIKLSGNERKKCLKDVVALDKEQLPPSEPCKRCDMVHEIGAVSYNCAAACNYS